MRLPEININDFLDHELDPGDFSLQNPSKKDPYSVESLRGNAPDPSRDFLAEFLRNPATVASDPQAGANLANNDPNFEFMFDNANPEMRSVKMFPVAPAEDPANTFEAKSVPKEEPGPRDGGLLSDVMQPGALGAMSVLGKIQQREEAAIAEPILRLIRRGLPVFGDTPDPAGDESILRELLGKMGKLGPAGLLSGRADSEASLRGASGQSISRYKQGEQAQFGDIFREFNIPESVSATAGAVMQGALPSNIPFEKLAAPLTVGVLREGRSLLERLVPKAEKTVAPFVSGFVAPYKNVTRKTLGEIEQAVQDPSFGLHLNRVKNFANQNGLNDAKVSTVAGAWHSPEYGSSFEPSAAISGYGIDPDAAVATLAQTGKLSQDSPLEQSAVLLFREGEDGKAGYLKTPEMDRETLEKLNKYLWGNQIGASFPDFNRVEIAVPDYNSAAEIADGLKNTFGIDSTILRGHFDEIADKEYQERIGKWNKKAVRSRNAAKRAAVKNVSRKKKLKLEKITTKKIYEDAVSEQGLKRIGTKAPEDEQLARAVERAKIELTKFVKREDRGWRRKSEWYTKEVARMEELTKGILPELADENKMGVFKQGMAILSPIKSVQSDYDMAVIAMSDYLKTGKMPAFNSVSGKGFGPKIQPKALARLQELIDEKGEKGALDYLTAVNDYPTPKGRRINKEIGVVHEFGPKVGAFFMNLTGFSDEKTVDLWMSRQWNRWMGNPKFKGTETPSGPKQFKMIQKAMDTITQSVNADPEFQKLVGETKFSASEIQAMLWYYEKYFFKDSGANVELKSFADAAEVFAGKYEKSGIKTIKAYVAEK